MFENSLLFNNLGKDDTSTTNGVVWLDYKKLWLVLLLVGIASVAWGTWLYFSAGITTASSNTVLLELESPTSEPILYIDVSGAVLKPGIYSVEKGERIAKAIELAGGVSDQADMEYVHSTLNLSARLVDEQKVYIPYESQTIEGNGVIAKDQLDTASENLLISINTASIEQLDVLPRVGAATAKKIVEGRPYTSIEELTLKKVVSESVLSEIRKLIKI